MFEVENLYFSDIVTPLRGRDYYELSGNRYFLTKQQAVQLGNFLYGVAGETPPTQKKRGFIQRLMGG